MNSSIPTWLKGVALGGVLLVVAVSSYLFLRSPSLEIDPMVGRAILPPSQIPSFNLVDHHGKAFNRESLAGHWTLVSIGFTYCPDICPTTLLQMANVYRHLGQNPGEGNAPDFVFLSVDPFRDSREVLERYVKYFHDGFRGVNGKPKDIKQLIDSLGLYYAYTDQEDDHMLDSVLEDPGQDDYGVTHSSRLLVISPKVEVVAIMSPPFQPDNVTMFLEKLRRYYGDE